MIIHHNTYRRTRVAECTGGSGTIDRGNSWVNKRGQLSLGQKNAGGRTGEVHHIKVVTGHELNVHRLPQSSRVWRPPDSTSASLVIDMPRVRRCGVRISEDNQCQGQNEGRESATRKHWNKNFFCRVVYWGRERKNEKAN